MGNSTIVSRDAEEQGQCISVQDTEGVCFLILLCKRIGVHGLKQSERK